MKKKSVLLPIFLIVAVDVLGLTIVLPLLPFYAEKYGATPQIVGLLVTVYAFCQLLSGPFLGQASDRFGRKPMLLISQMGTLVGFLVLAFAHSLPVIFFSRVIDGITAGNLSVAQAYISDVTRPEDRAKSFGIIGIAFGLGFLIGPAISGYLSQYGYQYPIFAAALLSLTSILATSFLLPGGKVEHEMELAAEKGGALPAGKRLTLLNWGEYSQYFKRPELKFRLFQFFLFAFAFAAFTSGFALFAERRLMHDGHGWGPKEVGYLFAYAGALGILLQGGLIGRLVKRFGEANLVVSGFAAVAVGNFILSATHFLPQLIVASTVSSYGNGVLRPALTSLVSRNVHRREQGIVLGLTQSLTSLAQIIAPIFAGLLIEHGLLSSWALMAAGTALIGMAFGVWTNRNQNKKRVAL